MYLFLFLALPIFYIIFVQINEDKKSLSQGFMIFFGIFVAALFYLIDFFVSNSYVDFRYGVFKIYPHFFKIFTLIPFLICGLILFLFAKDKIAFKLQNFFPLLLGFYTVYLPYQIISKNANFDFFLLFVLPIIIFTMLILLDFSMNYIIFLIEKKLNKKILLIVIPLIIYVLGMPALLCSMYYQASLLPLVYIFVILQSAMVVLFNLFSTKIQGFFQK